MRQIAVAAFWAIALWAMPPHGACGEEMQIRIAWGGGAERLWEGSVGVSAPGKIASPRPLGIEADEPGSMWLESGRAVIRQRSLRAYDGIDVTVDAPESANLEIQLSAAGDTVRAAPIEIPLANLRADYFDKELDAHGNRLLVRRSPGDELRVTFDRPHLVLSPGENFAFALAPHLLPAKSDGKIKVRASLRPAGQDGELWLVQHEVDVGQSAAIPLEVTMPENEGVYEIVLSATQSATWPEAVREPLNWKKTVAERQIQVLVLALDSPVGPVASAPKLAQVVEIDPANSQWWELLTKLPQLPKFPRWWKGPLGNGAMRTVKHPLGELVRLNPNAESPDASWEAYTLPIKSPGRPHVLEVDYPSDVAQTLGISIVEPNAAGAVMPVGLDSGIDNPEPLVTEPPQWRRHRIVFWPRTRMPMVLVTNLRARSPAIYGKIRVLGGWEHLPPASLGPKHQQSTRMLTAFLDRPLFPENFSADELFDAWSGRSLDDWRTFHQGGSRLVEQLRHVGYNGLMIAVAADGSGIYPSELLEPTPRYDTGMFLAAGSDPVRKDVVEMLLRMFDREGLQLIPMVEFASPLPELEAIRRQGDDRQQSVEWIGPDGRTWCQTNPTRRNLAPYYNVLQPQVQEAMLGVVRELIGRYARRPSFAGLAVGLSPDGYAQLPGSQWGMDDETIARFENDTQVRIPARGPSRFADRAQFLNGEHRQMWLQWRAIQLSRFYRTIHAELTAARPDARLYLAGAGMLSGPELESQLRPTLPRRATMSEAMLEVGIDARHYQSEPGLVLLRPERIAPTGNLNARAVDLEMQRTPDVDRYFQPLSVPGSLFFHEPQEVRLESFDAQSPFRPSYALLVSQPIPSGGENRRRFVHSLATLDSQVLVDGGWLLPLGQEASLGDLVAVYRRLPAARFARVEEQSERDSPPVTFRWAQHAGGTYLYAVNDSPIRVAAEVRVNAPSDCRLKELTGGRAVDPLRRDASGTSWRVELQPYDLVAVQFSTPGVTFAQPKVIFPAQVEAALKPRIDALGGRTASLRAGPVWLDVLENPGFERPPDKDNNMTGWFALRRMGAAIEPDASQRHGGKASARISSTGPVASLVSRPFEPPKSGRLSLSVWLRIADPKVQPPLRLAVQGKRGDRWDYYRAAPIGADPTGLPASPVGTDWQRFVFPIEDLPLERLEQLQVRFDLMGAGDVWVDDVELSDLRFSDNEVKELSKMITLMHVHLHSGQVGDCLRLLDGYWPRFLEQNVPLRPGMMATDEPASAPPAPKASAAVKPTPPPRTGLFERVRNILPKPARF